MDIRAFVSFAAMTFVSAWSAQAQVTTMPFKIARSGVPLKLTAVSSINPNCSSRGTSEVRLIAQPAGGQITLKYASDYPSLPASDPAFACDRRRVPATLVYYRSSPGFRGNDSVDLELVFPTGTVRHAHYTIQVE